jgi:outer membrane protein TolC
MAARRGVGGESGSPLFENLGEPCPENGQGDEKVSSETETKPQPQEQKEIGMQEIRRKKWKACALVVAFLGSLSALPRGSSADDRETTSALGVDVSDAETPLAEDGFSIEAVLAYARAHSPAMRAAQSRLLAARHVPAQVSAYDDPMVMWDNWNTPENLRIDQAGNNILRLSQKIPFPGKLRLKGEIAAKEAERSAEELRATEVDTVAQVKKAYYDLWLVHQNLQVYSRDKELVAQFARIAEQKYAVGLVSQPDVLRAQVELTRLINRVTTETLALGTAQAQLNALLSRPPEAPLGIPQDPPPPVVTYSLADLEALALANRPELMAQARAIERENLALALARKAYYPDFEVSVSRFINFGQRDGFGLVVSATIPLAFKGKYDAGVEEAVANTQTAQSELRRLQDLALFEVKQALVEAQTALEQLNLFLYTHIPQAEQALAASQIGYQTGVIDFLSLIDSVRAVEQVHLEHLMAAANFEKAWAELERAVGHELPRVKKEMR